MNEWKQNEEKHYQIILPMKFFVEKTENAFDLLLPKDAGRTTNSEYGIYNREKRSKWNVIKKKY